LPAEDFIFSAGGGFLFGAVAGYAKYSEYIAEHPGERKADNN
jgi:hypothetical protein